jgi:hypothetical protein
MKFNNRPRKGGSAPGIICIEREFLTVNQVAERLKMTRTNTDTLLRKLRKEPGAITWARLRSGK